MTAAENLPSLTNRQLVALWNIVQMSKRMLSVSSDSVLFADRLEDSVALLLTQRHIPHEAGKLIKEDASGT